MKKYFKYILLSAIGTLLMSSCDLTREPKNSMPAGNSLVSLSDAASWNAGFLGTFRGRVYGIYDLAPDRQADQLNASVDFGNRGGGFYAWGFDDSDYDLRDIWQGYYYALKNINRFLELAPNLTLSETEQAQFNTYRGNAHILRAYYFFELTKRYGNIYNSATADTDLSVPMPLTYNPNDLPARSTNKQVYEQIFKDIEAARTYLAKVPGAPMSKVPTIDVCDALEARVALEMKDWNRAYTAANKLVAANTYPLVKPVAENFQKMWYGDTSTEEIFMISISKPDELPNGGVGFGANATAAISACQPDWLPTQWMLDLYGETDLRKAVYFSKQRTYYGGKHYEGLYVVAKFRGNPTYDDAQSPIWGTVPKGVIAPKVFRIAEQYLIAAEAAAMSSKDAEALALLNKLRVSRGLAEVNASGDNLKSEIRNERARELAYEGQRLYDLRRWGMDVVRKSPQKIDGATPFLSNMSNPETAVYKVGHDKWIWGIPRNDMNTNKNLVQNKGW